MLYFSGLASVSEVNMLVTAGIESVLVDPSDLQHSYGKFPQIALDSGAYRAWKKGTVLDIDHYLSVVDGGNYDFHVAPDVIGEPLATRANWELYSRSGMIPVWHWGSDPQLLEDYLTESEIVVIGALVPLMREKDNEMLKCLRQLCEKYPERLHLFGANWLKAINELNDIAASIDTSKFLDAARYGHLIFIHERTGKLHQAPAKVLGYGELDRFERCVQSALAMNVWCNNKQSTEQ